MTNYWYINADKLDDKYRPGGHVSTWIMIITYEPLVVTYSPPVNPYGPPIAPNYPLGFRMYPNGSHIFGKDPESTHGPCDDQNK